MARGGPAGPARGRSRPIHLRRWRHGVGRLHAAVGLERSQAVESTSVGRAPSVSQTGAAE